MAYLSATNVESAVVAATTGSAASFTKLITLPNLTWEGRTSHAVRIAGGTAAERIGVYFVGALHAREWGGSDILVRLIQDLTRAYAGGTGLRYGNAVFTAADIAAVVESLNLYVFPQANPDGRHYSMTVDPLWRKNRRPGPQVGVDINRNFDHLWHYPTYFSPASAIQASTYEWAETYIGPAAESEPETRNVAWIVDTNPEVRFFVDMHCYAQTILFGWGDDEPQHLVPEMNFANRTWDGQRGVMRDVYQEYLPGPLHDFDESLGLRMRDAIVAAGGPAYQVQPSFKLYPTSGTSTCRFFQARFADRGKGSVHAYTVEWGTAFQPPWEQMAGVVEHLCAALLTLCREVALTHSDVYIRRHATDTGGSPTGPDYKASPDVVVRWADDGVLANQDVRVGRDHYVYVRVTNRGPGATRPLTVTVRAAADTGGDFLFPRDWTTDANHLPLVPLGADFTGVPAGATRLARFLLPAAHTAVMRQWADRGATPALLAEVDCVSDFGTPVGRHVWENNNLAQRNLVLRPPV